jgi:outer membrane murein-binding lipoprotein Lpp
MIMIKYTWFSASLAVVLGGCASYAPPNDHLATSMASLRAAEEVGASKDPQAALHVRLAQEEVNRAKQLMADGDNERADYATMRANADAQLAVMLMRENAAKTKAQEATAKLQQIGSQTMTTSGTQSVTPPSTPPVQVAPAPVSPTLPANSKPTAPAPATTH